MKCLITFCLLTIGLSAVQAQVQINKPKEADRQAPPVAPALTRSEVAGLPAGQGVPGANLSAPAWMKQGLRISYRTNVATQSTRPNNEGGGAGAGIITVDIVAVAQGRVAYDTRFFVGGDANNPAVNSTAYGTVAPVGATGVYWLHPQTLQQIIKNPPAGQKISGGLVEINGKQVNAVRVQQGEAAKDGQETTIYYDPQSGIALQILTKSVGSGMTQTSYTILADTRERTLPWKMGRPPSWLSKYKRYTYTGGISMQMQGAPQMPATPLTAVAEVIEVGANYLAMKQTVQVGNLMGGGNQQPIVVPCVVHGAGQLGSCYLPPMELKQLRQGQVLDEDKVLNSKISVIGVGQTQYGRNVVTIAEDSPGFASYYDYELETGMLLASAYQNKTLNQTIQVILTGLQ